jgi:hypothetical protein
MYHIIVQMSRKPQRKYPYHAYNKAPAKPAKVRKRLGGIIIFWLFFFVLISCLFLVYQDRIQKTMREAHLPAWFFKPPVEQKPEDTIPDEFPALMWEEIPPEDLPDSEPVLSLVPEDSPPVQEAPAEVIRALYFIQVDQNGDIRQIRVTRRFPRSNSPMLDVLKQLVLGPTVEEQSRGLISLIPQGTGILSAIVRGETAYISFTDDFKYNTFGAEGYIAQLKQVLWTVQEFPDIRDVQILIDGRVLDFLSEGIQIGRPISRDIF